jgi:hypothetical protein
VLEREADQPPIDDGNQTEPGKHLFLPESIYRESAKGVPCGSSGRPKPLPDAAMDALFTYDIDFAQASSRNLWEWWDSEGFPLFLHELRVLLSFSFI